MEKHRWMLDVLTDLENYSRLNGLSEVQEKVANAREVMLSEVAAKLEGRLEERQTKT